MASPDSVQQLTQDNFWHFRLAQVAVPLTANGNAVAVLPILSGGIGSPYGNGSYIIRGITVTNPSNTVSGGTVPSMATANVAILTSADGNTSNAVTTAAGQLLANVTGVRTWQDLTLASGAATTAYAAPALFVQVNANVANAQANITVWGDIVSL